MNKEISMKATPSVLLVTSWEYPHLGGVSSHIGLLAQCLNIDDDDVISFRHIIDYSKYGLRRFIFLAERQVKRALKRETISQYAARLQAILEAHDADVVHCHDAMAAWAALKARHATGKKYKIVVTVHGPFSRHMVEEGASPDSPDVLKVAECERIAWTKSDAIIAVDKTQADVVQSQGGDRAKIHVIENAVDVEKVTARAAALPVVNSSKQPWVFVPRRLTPKNGIEYAIRAIASMKSRPRLLLAGNGIELTKLEHLAHELGVEKDVLFCGGLEHAVMIPLMAAADAVLIPSVPVHGIEEATSIATLEAMALGKAVIATTVGGLKELIHHEVEGILVPPRDSAAIAAALRRLLASAPLRSRLGKNARKAVQQRFSVAQWIERVRSVYHSL